LGWENRRGGQLRHTLLEKLNGLIFALTTAAVMRKLNVRWPLFTRHVNTRGRHKSRVTWDAVHVKLSYRTSKTSSQCSLNICHKFVLRLFKKKKTTDLRKKEVISLVKEMGIAVIRRRRGRNRKAKAKMDFSGRIVRGTMKGKSPSV